MINNVRDHVSPELETLPPRWSELGEAEMLRDSPRSIENFLEDLQSRTAIRDGAADALTDSPEREE
jgi:hypothetical protein